MAEYIDREALEKAMTVAAVNGKDKDRRTWAKAICVLHDIPTVDLVPVVHGWWEDVDSSYWRWTPSGAVSVPHRTYRCGRCWRGTVVKTNYCPNCGAKMNEKEATYD